MRYSVGQVAQAVHNANGLLMVTADHGNAEQMRDPVTGGPHTYHTTNPVPFILIAPDDTPWRRCELKEGGRLCDIAPTILDIMHITTAPDMTCRSLIEHENVIPS